MAESTLSLSRSDLRKAVAYYLGYGRTEASWSADQQADIDACVAMGLRQFYVPPPLDGLQHTWSFLRPVSTIDVDDTAEDYALPAAFGGIVGDLTFDATHNYSSLPVVGEGQIRDLRRRGHSPGIPRLAAIRWKATDGTGQRAELLLFPKPDTDYTLAYCSTVLPDALTGSQYPLGGEAHADTLQESCLAAAELHMNDERGVHYAQFMDRLRASIIYDIKNFSPETVGYNGDGSNGLDVDRRHTGVRVSYRGVFY